MPRNLLTAIWQGRCPKCRDGHIFKFTLRDFRKFSEMNNVCPSCSASFNPEPGFYFGALYVSYAFTVALFVAVWMVLYFFVNPPDWAYILVIVLSSIIFIPISFRYSRILFLYWFGGLQKQK